MLGSNPATTSLVTFAEEKLCNSATIAPKALILQSLPMRRGVEATQENRYACAPISTLSGRHHPSCQLYQACSRPDSCERGHSEKLFHVEQFRNLVTLVPQTLPLM